MFSREKINDPHNTMGASPRNRDRGTKTWHVTVTVNGKLTNSMDVKADTAPMAKQLAKQHLHRHGVESSVLDDCLTDFKAVKQ